MHNEWTDKGFGSRFHRFQNLMKSRIQDILLVSSPYDLFVFEEDGRLYESIRNEYQLLNLSHAPDITRIDSGEKALKMIKEDDRFDLIITTLHITDMHPNQFARMVRKEGISAPIVLLSFDNRELREMVSTEEKSDFDGVFIWQGDFRLIIAIIKYLEDKLNVDNDTKTVGVQSIILIEDNIMFYSSFLPIIYTELLKQSQRLISEGINITHKFLRMRARPKILLCSDYETAWRYFQNYKKYILGVISDVEFHRNGKDDTSAGLEFARNVKAEFPDIPVLLQSNLPDYREKAQQVANLFLLKDSPTLLADVRKFIMDFFGFGDFIFRTQEGKEVGRASNLKSLEEVLKTVPGHSIKYHAERNHFSNWLKARTEFDLAHSLRPKKVSEFESIEHLRNMLVSTLHEYQINRQRGFILDFSKETFDPLSSFARIGVGSLGGKARGLGFINIIINNYNIREKFDDVLVSVPAAIVLATDIFDQFIEENKLKNFALKCQNDEEITKKFLDAEFFSEEVVKKLRDFLEIMPVPLAVRSSSILEDSQFQPFAGVYETYMLPNNHPDINVKLKALIDTIKRVYASTYYKDAKDYINITSYRLEEEKMAVIVQKLSGSIHGNRFYPDFAGVCKSYNFYPVYPQTSGDGIVSVALGLGRTVVEGGRTVRFAPKYPNHLPQFTTIDYILKNNQYEFYALDLEAGTETLSGTHDMLVKKFKLSDAEFDGTLNYLGSTYSAENNAIYDGLSRNGTRLVTFAPVLKNKIFPLPEITQLLLDISSWGLGAPVEMEFAVNLSVPPGRKKEFSVLQLRPLVLRREVDEVDLSDIDKNQLISRSSKVLGNGTIEDICDIVYVDINKYERDKSREVAKEVSYFNHKLLSDKIPYLLIGVGRWGTLDPWLGIPVTWEQICGARTIVETSFKDFDVTLSQGSHFFQNLTSFMIGYFTVDSRNDSDFIDWEWLRNHTADEETNYVKHIKLNKPLKVKMNGHQNKGVIIKPE